MVVPTVEPSDETLAARAAAGDDRAFEAIVERYQGRVYRLACRLTSDTDAPDVLQDTHGVHLATPAELQVASRADELLDRQILADKARRGIARLPDIYRDAFVLRDLEEMSTADVAHALGVEPATVRQRVHRARLMLRGYLSDLVGVKP
ncbi:MAG TPA: sigma factor-like helix-turn-helix DNA-binding protein [Vicinamibacterales bacterium]|nr:sigma factor-like helix-turn-helix DNA-binding protein [Vicinamibacterales bacterium]